MNLMDHAINLLGVKPGTAKRPSVGVTVTKVEWHGCMATKREEVDVGDLLRYEEQRGYEGMIVRYDKVGERWEPLAHVRIVDGATEVWT